MMTLDFCIFLRALTYIHAYIHTRVGKYEERVAIATNTGIHVFSSTLAVIPYDEWTHVSIVCSEDPRLKLKGNQDNKEWRPSSRIDSRSGSRSSTRESKRPTTSERKEEERIHRILAGGPEETPPSSPSSGVRKTSHDEDDENTNDDGNDVDGNADNDHDVEGQENKGGDNPSTDDQVSTFICLYINGKAAGEIKGVSCNLPMKSIGCEEFSFHGCLLDARYWHKPRSAKEIEFFMNRLLKLSEDKPLKGLVGWWTFEDGWGEKVSICKVTFMLTCISLNVLIVVLQMTTDVSEQRFRVPIRGFRYDLREEENKRISEKQEILVDAERRLEKAINSGGTSHEKISAKHAVDEASHELSLLSPNHQLRPVIKTEWSWVDAVKVG